MIECFCIRQLVNEALFWLWFGGSLAMGVGALGVGGAMGFLWLTERIAKFKTRFTTT